MQCIPFHINRIPSVLVSTRHHRMYNEPTTLAGHLMQPNLLHRFIPAPSQNHRSVHIHQVLRAQAFRYEHDGISFRCNEDISLGALGVSLHLSRDHIQSRKYQRPIRCRYVLSLGDAAHGFIQ